MKYVKIKFKSYETDCNNFKLLIKENDIFEIVKNDCYEGAPFVVFNTENYKTIRLGIINETKSYIVGATKKIKIIVEDASYVFDVMED